jgi:multiple antibiotic resistance protein
MQIDFGFLWLAFMGLLAIINPVGAAVVFFSATAEDTHRHRVHQAKKAVIIATLILLFFLITGSLVFTVFQITLEAFRIGGGIIIAVMGYHMIVVRPKQTEEEKKESMEKTDVSITPMAVPLLAGPGAISSVLMFGSQSSNFVESIILGVIILILGFLTYIFLANAEVLKRTLGHNGVNVIERLMGLIVLVIGVQFIIDALRVVLPTMI